MSVLRAGAVLALLVAVAAAQRVPLRSVESLVFEAGKMTAGRRTAPVPQMVQTNRRDIGVRSIYCRNVGWDGQNVNWECRLPDDVPARLGAFAIECEGYDYAGDANHLAGSCGIRYELLPASAAYTASAATGRADSPLWVVLAVMAPVAFLVAVAAIVICLIQEAVRRAPKTENLLDLDAPAVPAAPAWDVSSKDSDDESSELDYDSLPSSCASSRSGSPVRQRRAPAAQTTHVHVHAPAPPLRDAFADLALMSALAPRPRPAPTIVVQAPAPAPVIVQTPAPTPMPAPAPTPVAVHTPTAPVAYGKSSTTRETSYEYASPTAPAAYGKSTTARETSYEPAVEYSAGKSKTDDSWFGLSSSSSSTGSSKSSGWSASSSTGKSTTR